MPFVAPKSTTATTNAGRSTFRPPWVKEDTTTSNAKPTVPWAKKTATTTAADKDKEKEKEKENGEKTATTKKATTTAAKKTAEPTKKVEPAKKAAEPTKKVVEPAKKIAPPMKSAEPIKKPATTAAAKTTTTKTPLKKKEPTPSSSSEEEETEEEEESEEETSEEEESEEDDDEAIAGKLDEKELEKLAALSDFDLSDNEFAQPSLRLGVKLKKTPQAEKKKNEIPAPPPLPSLVPKAPPPPPPPLGAPSDKKELSQGQKAVIEKLKTRPRRRPDWSEMMKEVESGKKLRHVVCNDRSQPILSCKSLTKVDDKFIYETEKDNSHNKLLKQIQTGFKLKPTQTNDRSKPFIEGLRKFRKQMTIEEQIQKSQSKINLLAEAATAAVGSAGTSDPAIITNSIVAALAIDDPSGDELDDIDKIRDDLQSTKQMLALELRNREAQERENKKLLAQIATLEAELEREKSREKNLEYGSRIIVATMEPSTASEEAYLNSLKQEADDARKSAKDLEKKYLDTGELLDQAKSEIDEQKRQIQMLERKLAQALQGDATPKPCPICAKKQQTKYFYSCEDPDDDDTYYGFDSYANGHTNNKGGGSLNGSRRPSDVHGDDSANELDLDMSESDPDEPEEKKAERREKRAAKEVKILRSKLTKVKTKQEAAKKEKMALKQAMKKNHVILKEENKKFKKLEKEVQKMAASMKDEEEDEDADEEKEEEEAEEEEEQEDSEEEEESEESESEESEAETESESEAEEASSTDKKNNLEPRLKKHESRLLAMKKCNVLLQANVDNLQDEITQVRAKAANLQSELDAVLADLGF
ncbi:axoneme-associated protein mst101(2) isoform X4 [Eurosta solidaginis]|uniref:axoneme-associated protein mst101(2) isoform X4 n=1 Tax=Eurosta solidaginis TaxID=178769 RepID=UPI00353117D4